MLRANTEAQALRCGRAFDITLQHSSSVTRVFGTSGGQAIDATPAGSATSHSGPDYGECIETNELLV